MKTANTLHWPGLIAGIVLTVITAGWTVASAAQHDGGRDAGRRSRMAEPQALSVMPFLRQLELTDAQRQSIQSVTEASRSQRDALRERQREHAAALRATLPDSPGYLALVETSKQLAAEAIQQRSDLQTQIYKLLTPEQKARLPQLIAERKAAIEQQRQQRMERRRRSTPQA